MINFNLQTFAEDGASADSGVSTPDTGAQGAGVAGSQEAGTQGTATQGASTQDVNLGSASTPEVLDFGKVTIPEGITLNDNFRALAKDIGLTNDGASKLLAYAKTDIFDHIATAQQEAQKELIAGWTKESQTQFAGEKLEIAKHAYKAYADEGLQKFMDETGLGCHPAMIKLFYTLGSQMQEGKLVLGGGHDNPNSANAMFAKSISMMGK